MNKEPDYGFDNGLHVSVIRYEKSGGEYTAEAGWDRQTLVGLPTVGQDVMRDQEVTKQLEAAYVARLGGIAIEMAAVGNENSDDIHLVYYGWGSNSRNPIAVYEAQAMVAGNPGGLFLFTNAPGTGKSSLLSPPLAAEIRQGNYEVYGELAAKAARRMTDGRRVYMNGHSLGSRSAIAATPYINDGGGVEALIVNDPPGSEELHLGQLAMRFGVHETRHARRYSRAGIDNASLTLQIMDGLSRHQFLVEPFGLSERTLEHNLGEAARYVKSEVRVLLPALSALNDWRAIAGIVQRVRLASDTNATLEAWVIENHTHSWMTGARSVGAMLYDERRVQSPVPG